MRITAWLTPLLLAAAPASAWHEARQPANEPAVEAVATALPALNEADAARAQDLLFDAVTQLLADRRAAAAPPLDAALKLAGPPADVARLADQPNDVYRRWLDAESAAWRARDWPRYTRWAVLTAGYRLSFPARDRAADAAPLTGETFDPVYPLAYGLFLSGRPDRVRALVQPFLATPDPQFERAFAEHLLGRAQSTQSWGGPDKGKAHDFIALILSLFDRPGARATAQLRGFHTLLGDLRRRSGDIAGARAAYARARAPGAPPADAEIALMFDAGEGDAGLRAVQQALGEPPGAPPSRAAADRLVAIAGQTGGGHAGTIAILRLAVQGYRRLLKPDDKVLENALSTLAGALMEAGEAAQAEPLLAELFASYERRFGFDSGGANIYASRLAAAIAAQGRHDEADLLYRRLWSLVERYGAYHDDDAQRYAEAIAGIAIARDQLAAAEAFNGDALRRARTSNELDDATRAAYLVTQARILTLAGKLVAAEAAAREAIAAGPADDQFTVSAAFDTPAARARAQLAAVLEARGRAGEAEPLRRLLLARIEANDMIPWEGTLRRDALLALAANLTLQDEPAGRAMFADRLAANIRIFGADSPQALDVAEPFARALLRAGRAGEALVPARAALTARTSSRYLGDAAGITASDRARADRRREAARRMVEAAWRARR